MFSIFVSVLFCLPWYFVAAEPPALKQGEFTAELNGLKLWYKVSGQGPVCLMPNPAWGPSSDLYFRTLKPLEKYFTMVYLDCRGTGRSERAKSGKEYSWVHLVNDLEALRNHLGIEKCWLMGHSEGGILALHFACKHPNRVNGLVLIASAAVITPKDDQAAMARAMKRKNEPWFADALKVQFAGPPKTDEQFAAGMKKMMPAYWADPSRIAKHQEHFEATTLSASAFAGQSESKRLHFDLSADLKKVTVPALIIVGDKDDACPPAMSRTIHLGLANSKYLQFQDCGHFPWLEQSAEFETQVPLFLKALGVP